MTKDEINELLSGTVDEIKAELADLSNEDLSALHDAEENGRNRSTLLAAIDAHREPSTDEDEAEQDAPEAKPEEDTDYASEYPLEFEQGRRARMSAVDLDNAPYDNSTVQYRAYEAGHGSVGSNFEDAELRMQTGPLEDEANAEGQMGTVSEANK